MIGIWRWVAGWALASVVFAALGAVVEAQHTLGMLPGLGEVAFADRARHIGTTLTGFAPLYGAIVAGLFAALFAIAGFIGYVARGLRGLAFFLAGAAAPLLVALVLQLQFGVPVVQSFSAPTGAFALAAAGALAGVIASVVSAPPRAKRPALGDAAAVGPG